MKILNVYSSMNNDINLFFYMSIKITIIDTNSVKIKKIYKVNQINSQIECLYKNDTLYIIQGTGINSVYLIVEFDEINKVNNDKSIYIISKSKESNSLLFMYR